MPKDEAQIEYLGDRLLNAPPSEVRIIRDLLEPYKNAALLDKFWAVATAPETDKKAQRLRGDCLLDDVPDGLP